MENTLPPQSPSKSRFNLEERTLRFAADVRVFVSKLPRSMIASDDVRQLVRASGSVGANYIEANEALGKKDFIMRIRICLKEAKESSFWLRLISVGTSERLIAERNRLAQEAKELLRIFFAILKTIRSKEKAASEAAAVAV
ncbi:four helix bundle protein [Candidatus Peregrinibacteria bacterium]|nr:four helix bundle protein [Candidatus Peregrinibacteria bacterium]MBI3816359.1 four helix bundle protein [Candidatus Peregrinibacteria bacterium]